MNKCTICGREGDPQYFEDHHLEPASKRKDSATILVDHQCGDIIHQFFENYQLKTQYNTLDKLLSSEKIQNWIKWVRKQPLEKRVVMAQKKRK